MPPERRERDRERMKRTVEAIAATFLAAILVTIGVLFVVPEPPSLFGLAILAGSIALLVLTRWLARRGRVDLASGVLIGMAFVATSAGLVGAGSLDTPAYPFYAVSIAAAGLLIGSRAALVTAGLAALVGGVVALLQAHGDLTPQITYPLVSHWWLGMVLFAAIAGLVVITVDRIDAALQESLASEEKLAQRNRELVESVAEMHRAQASEQLLNLATDQAHDAIAVTAPGGRILYSNAAFHQLVGIEGDSGAEFQATALLELLDDEVRREIDHSLQTQSHWRGRIRLRVAGREPPLVEASMAPVIDDAGETKAYVAVLADITREADLETELQQAQKMEALGRLAGGVAHDFNNLLVVIQGYAEILGQNLAAGADAEEAVEAIVDASSKASELTSSLLAFGRKQVVRPRIVDLNALLRDTTGMIRRIVDEHVTIETELAPALWNIQVDPGQINQVLLNLVANARDAMSEGGTLRITTANADRLPEAAASLRDAPAVVMLSVADTGEGMNEATRARIFEPFFTTKGVAEGTGLGLASAYGIIERFGGAIDVESTPGEGTCFRIYLPGTDASLDDEAQESVPLAAPAPSLRILVVEDQPMLLRMVQRILEQAGHHVIACDSGRAAIEAFETAEPACDLVITDVTMPEMSGTELADRLRTRRSDLRVLYTSGYSADQLGDRLDNEPLSDFLSKPFDATRLLAGLQDLTARQPPLRTHG